MVRFALSTFACFALTLLVVSPLQAQRARLSPHETISQVIDGNRVTLVYGRPYSKDPKGTDIRVIWGKLVPYASVWRMGADEATMLITQQPLVFGTTTVPAGAYTLAMQPEENGASHLIINKQLGQWGVPYTGKDTELARIELKKDALDKNVDQFTIVLEKNPAGGGLLKLTWEKTQYSVAFTVKK